MSLVRRLLACAAARPASPLAAPAQTLRVGLAEDPDVLDPTLARSFVGRIVFAALCDKLFDIDEKLHIVPQLATGYEWSADSKALTMKLRHGRDLPRRREVRRRGGQVQHRAPQDDGRLEPPRRARAGDQRRRRRPDDGAAQPLGAVLAAAGAARRPRRHDGLAEGGAGRGRQVRRQAGVLGPVQVRRARRAGPHRRSSATPATGTRPTIHFDKVVYTPIPDATVRLANLRSGQLDFIERVAPRDMEKLEDRQEAQDRAHHRDRLPGHHDQRRQERAGAEEPARPRRARARGVRARARPRRASCRW